MTIKKLILLFALCCAFFSCKKTKNDPNPASEEPSQMLGQAALHLHYYVNNTELETLDFETPVNKSGTERKISIGYGQFYISSIEYIKSDGSLYSLPDAIVLKKGILAPHIVGKLPVGIYKGIRFKIGLSANEDTSVSSNELNDPAMLFGTKKQGHVFVYIQGKIDTSTNATGTLQQMQPFTIKIGTPSHLVNIYNLPLRDIVIREDGFDYLHIVLDVAKLFKDVQLNKAENLSVSSISDNHLPVASQFAANIHDAVRFE